ncbi:MAG TPA: hypothetical protein VEY09_11775 [Pyrinomonadaceae bacterium]|nr:hypothetical protein [Pyrinomonadaceae bacterium]
MKRGSSITPTAGPRGSSSSPVAARGALALSLLVALCGAAAAQEGQPGQPGQARQQKVEAGPPPLKYIPEESRQRLAGARNIKDRVKVSLDMAEERLSMAAAHVDADRFEGATAELGIYEAVVKDAIKFVQNSGPVTNKQRDLFKRIELTLRAHTPRIETIRRGLPASHAVHIEAAIEFVRDARTEALDAFFDNTVLREQQSVKSPSAAGVRAASDASASAPPKEKPPQQR